MAVVIGALVLLLSGCGGNEAGPKVARPAGDPGPDALPIKLNALTVDDCFLSPSLQIPKGCEKYVTELGGTVNTLRDRATTSKDPKLNDEADGLSKAVAAYRSNSCDTVTASGNGPCKNALVDIAGTLAVIKANVLKQGTTG
jgi:hypothetical protein